MIRDLNIQHAGLEKIWRLKSTNRLVALLLNHITVLKKIKLNKCEAKDDMTISKCMKSTRKKFMTNGAKFVSTN